jgi:hypothetical protein
VNEHSVRSRGSYIAYSKYAGHVHLSDVLRAECRTSLYTNISIQLLITSIVLPGAIGTEVIHFLRNDHSKVVCRYVVNFCV